MCHCRVWDALSVEKAAKVVAKAKSDKANALVEKAIASRGLRDDTTAMIIDVRPDGGEDNESERTPSPSGIRFVFHRMMGTSRKSTSSSDAGSEGFGNMPHDMDASVKGGVKYSPSLGANRNVAF